MTNSPADNPDDKDMYRDWSHDLTDLQEIGEEILERWRDQNPNSPRDYPTVRWLTDNGFSHLRWVLREKHEMGTPEFFILFSSSGGERGYEWRFDDVATRGFANNYLEDQVECRGWADGTKRTARSRINGVFWRFNEKYGDAAVVAHANDPDRQQELYSTFKQVAKDLREELSSDESFLKYLRAAHRFFEWLERSNRIEFDPMEDIEEEFNLNIDSDPTPLTDSQVRRLWIAAETDEERMLVIGYCVWGVRTKELPAVHVDKLHLDRPNPVIRFVEEDRKNGSGEVSLLFGLDALAQLLDKHARKPGWNGHLFPSPMDDQSFLCGKQMRTKFKELCRRANVTIDGTAATPKHGRSFYYNVLADAETDLLEMAGEIAEEQTSEDPASVRDYYLTPERRRRYRRIFFRLRIREILPDDAYVDSGNNTGSDSTLDDFE
jgi:site-specific recombinase XerD